LRNVLMFLTKLPGVAETVHHLFCERGNSAATMWLRMPSMKAHRNDVRIPAAVYRYLTAIGLAVLVVGLMFASKGGV
jgi:hypothetical protein